MRCCTSDLRPPGLIDGVLGNASKVDNAEIQKEFARILAPGEKVEHAYQLIRDYFVFTDKRFVLVDKQGLTGSKMEYHSIPYKSITHFSIETGGTFDLDAELKIWISGTPLPILKKFNKKLSIYEVQAVLASYVLR
jgi:Bacterial PH domain